MHLAEIMTMPCSEFCRRLYPDLLPTDSPGNRITPTASARRNLELRNTETCGKYRRDINQDLLETFFFSSLFHIRQWQRRSIATVAVCLAKQIHEPRDCSFFRTIGGTMLISCKRNDAQQLIIHSHLAGIVNT